jgi:hypothetical protein
MLLIVQQNKRLSADQFYLLWVEGGGGATVTLFFINNFLVERKRKYVRVCSCDARAISFGTKVRGEVLAHFHAITVKHHSSMWN